MLRRWRPMCMLHCLLASFITGQVPDDSPGVNRFSYSTLQLGLHACGWEKFCSVTSDSPEVENISANATCCKQCSCDESCWMFGDCCPDVPGHGGPLDKNGVELQCHDSLLDVNGPSNNWLFETYIKMIIQCPSIFGRSQTEGLPQSWSAVDVNMTIQMCQEPFGLHFNKFDFSFYDIVPVTGSDGIIYNNVHCASCHSMYDVTFWEIQATKCNEKPRGGVPTSGFLIDNCELRAFPPTSVQDSLTRAICQSVYTNCLTSENASEDDLELARACSFSQFPARPNSRLGSGNIKIPYGNIFCLLCDLPSSTPLLSCEADPGRTIFGSYRDLFRIPLDTDISSTPAAIAPVKYPCQQDQIFDHFQDSCRELVCPFTTEPTFGSCVPSKFILTNHYIDFIARVDLESTESLIIRDIFAYLGNDFFQIIGLSSNCKVCNVYLDYEGRPIDTLLMVISARVSTGCTLDMITSAIVPHKGISYHLKAPFGGTKKNVSLQLFPVNSKNVSVYMKTGCGGTLLNKLFDCPFIVLNDSEYCTWEVMSGSDNISMCYTSLQHETKFEFENSIEMFYEHGERYIRMCTSRYFGSMTLSATGKSDSLAKDILSLVCTCLSMVCTCFAIALVLYRTHVKTLPTHLLLTGMVTHVLAQGVFQFGIDWPEAVGICPIVGMIIHYLWLATIFAFNTYCMAVCYTVQRRVRFGFSIKMVSSIMCYILLLPLLFVVINIVYSNRNRKVWENPYGYGTRLCFIDSVFMNGVVFVLPILFCVVVNCGVYFGIVFTIRKQAAVSRMVGINRDYASVYFRMLVIAGFTWLLGFLNEFVGSEVLEYVFIICFGCQGVFLLLAFSSIYKPRIRKDRFSSTSSAFTASTVVNTNGHRNMENLD